MHIQGYRGDPRAEHQQVKLLLSERSTRHSESIWTTSYACLLVRLVAVPLMMVTVRLGITGRAGWLACWLLCSRTVEWDPKDGC